ncbi:hypothetical protein [Thiorhodococcus minor]|uniref:Uncharacterized protein n=1 Tax=Thiorhodococcus minor TaxID=57489 RepID=A0A6M0K6B4_9GAMM|nr:hypothetical protein [Thiorhodococcus minor]NEV64137.1 hypothetical protein [Thiorhodococcus minor]
MTDPIDPGPPVLTEQERADIHEAVTERAAILEHDAGLPRQQAERRAVSAMRIYRYRLAERPETWLLMIAPGCTLDEARHALSLRFGVKRLLEVREHRPGRAETQRRG